MADFKLNYTGAQINTLLEKVNGITHTPAQIDAAINNSIVEKGTATGTVNGTGENMTWDYIKWDNGLACCFGKAISARSCTAAGNVYYCAGTDPYWTFPSGLFVSAPNLSISISNVSDSSTWPWAGTGGSTTKANTCRMTVFAYKQWSSTLTVQFHLIAWGFWK